MSIPHGAISCQYPDDVCDREYHFKPSECRGGQSGSNTLNVAGVSVGLPPSDEYDGDGPYYQDYGLLSGDPVDVDTDLSKFYETLMQRRYQRANAATARERAQRWRDEHPNSWEARPDYLDRQMEKYDAIIQEQDAIIADTQRSMQPYEDFYDAAPWPRAFLVVTNGVGHVHKNMRCSTCFPSTQYAWMVDYSGQDEGQIIDAAGERACTVCYPDAPVESLGKPTKMFSKEEEEKKQRQRERARKRAERDQRKVLDPITYQPLYKTERAAKNRISRDIQSLLIYSDGHPSAGEWQEDISRTADALYAKSHDGRMPSSQQAQRMFDEIAHRAQRKLLREAKKRGIDEGHEYIQRIKDASQVRYIAPPQTDVHSA